METLYTQRREEWQKKPYGTLGTLWIHCASVGEFEQARPIIERYRQKFPDHLVVLTFFSPSGYELHKNCSLADKIFYLPLDTPRNAKRFVSAVSPTTAIFVKYEFWKNYLKTLQKNRISTYIISAIFRENQRFFKWWGVSFRKMLKAFTYFFVQDEDSRNLLNGIGFQNVSIAGDTRFDRVFRIVNERRGIKEIESFASDQQCIVAGSTWPADENILVAENAKMIIVPHQTDEKHIERLSELLKDKPFIRYSRLVASNVCQSEVTNAKVLIIDTIGILSVIYRYGSIAYIGGGFGAGIHNILEAAVYGIPVIFGPGYKKFKEARDLAALGGAFPVNGKKDYIWISSRLLEDEAFRVKAGEICRKYVTDNLGATEKIMNAIISAHKSVN